MIYTEKRAESGHLPRASASEWDSAILFLGTPGTSIPSVDFSFLVCEKGFDEEFELDGPK